MKWEIDEELWYGVSSDEQAEARAAKSMAARMGRIVGAKPFPAAAQRLSQITQNPNCSMDEVVGVLESDPALSARLLRLVNSVGYSLRTPCTSVRHAASLVGTEKLNQVASTAAILDMYESSGERAAELLEHATVVGALCRYLAFHFGLPPDELFTCGFLHDIGKLMLLETEGAEYLDVLGRERPEFDVTYIEERKRYGFDHALLAGHVLAAWNIPHPVPKVVAWHHHVTRAYAESTEISQMVSTLRLADAMSFALTRPDAEAQIETLARMEAASYMDISEGQLAAMWDEVRSLTERARAVFRGEKIDDVDRAHTSRPSHESLRAVAKAKQQPMRSLRPSGAPVLSERPKQFPCVVCDAPSYAHKCSACRGYVCPLHLTRDDEWCKLCHDAYQETGIPQIRPIVSTLFGALLGILLAAAFFGAASAGAQRPLRIMVGPTLILMLLGMLLGVAQRWVRRWWFLRTRPDRASVIPKVVEAVLDSAAKQAPTIVEVAPVSEPTPPTERLSDAEVEAQRAASAVRSRAPVIELELRDPKIPAPPAVPDLASPTAVVARPGAARPRHWMSSSQYRTPQPPSIDSLDGSEGTDSSPPTARTSTRPEGASVPPARSGAGGRGPSSAPPRSSRPSSADSARASSADAVRASSAPQRSSAAPSERSKARHGEDAAPSSERITQESLRAPTQDAAETRVSAPLAASVRSEGERRSARPSVAPPQPARGSRAPVASRRPSMRSASAVAASVRELDELELARTAEAAAAPHPDAELESHTRPIADVSEPTLAAAPAPRPASDPPRPPTAEPRSATGAAASRPAAAPMTASTRPEAPPAQPAAPANAPSAQPDAPSAQPAAASAKPASAEPAAASANAASAQPAAAPAQPAAVPAQPRERADGPRSNWTSVLDTQDGTASGW